MSSVCWCSARSSGQWHEEAFNWENVVFRLISYSVLLDVCDYTATCSIKDGCLYDCNFCYYNSFQTFIHLLIQSISHLFIKGTCDLYCLFRIPTLWCFQPNSFILAISVFYSAPSSPLLLRSRSRLQHRYCIGVSHRSAQATAGKGPAQGPYMAARAGVEPTTLRLRVIASTNAPPFPTLPLWDLFLFQNKLRGKGGLLSP